MDFATHWHTLFPLTYDNKVLASNARCFYNTSLGTLFDKVSSDDKFKHNLNFKYDSSHNFAGYEGTSHYHEAAYDAHMTGCVFAHVAKFKEIDSLKYKQRKDDKDLGKKGGITDKKEHEKENRQAVSNLKHKPVDLSDFAA